MMSELRQVRRAPEIDSPLTPVHGTSIDHPSAWTVADFKTPADYTIELDAAHLRDIEHAIRQIKTAGLGLDDLQREHFEVPSLRPAIDEIRRQIGDGWLRGGPPPTGRGLLERRDRHDLLGDRHASRSRAVAERPRRPARPRQGFQPRGPAGARLPQQTGTLAAHRFLRPSWAGLSGGRETGRRIAANQRHHCP